MNPALLFTLFGCSQPITGNFAPISGEDTADSATTPGDDTGGTTDTGPTDTDSGTSDGENPRQWPTISNGLPLEATPGANVIVIHTDTLRTDYLSTYDGVFDTLPLTKDEPWLVVGGLVSAGNWTPTATASFLTGLTPQRHDVRYLAQDKGTANVDVPVGITVADEYRRNGYRTALLTGNSLLEAELTEQTGFELLTQFPKHAGQSNAEVLVDDAIDFIDGLGGADRFFVMIQSMDAHDPFAAANEDVGTFVDPDDIPFDLDHDGYVYPTEIDMFMEGVTDSQERAAYTAAARALYAEQILGVDRATATLLDYLRTTGRIDNTIVVFAADHGESLDDHNDNRYGHGWTLQPEIVTVPLMILAPGTPAGSMWCTAENADIAPTLLRATGTPEMPGIDGVALQDGCRAWARSSWYEDQTGRLLEASATSKDAQVTRSCKEGHDNISDLQADPLGRVVGDPTDAGDGPAVLDAYIEDIREYQPTVYCD